MPDPTPERAPVSVEQRKKDRANLAQLAASLEVTWHETTFARVMLDVLERVEALERGLGRVVEPLRDSLRHGHDAHDDPPHRSDQRGRGA